jgi:cytochrome b pre-mRNA-processing protein 3
LIPEKGILSMLSRLFRGRREEARMATALYGGIVAKSRSPALYARLGVPDTVSGRFEMIVLHAFLVLQRLQAGGAVEQGIGQAAFDLFCVDMDRSLRELGVGDIGVPKRMRQVGQAFYGRTRAYAECIASGDETGLAAALQRNVLKAAGEAAAAIPLARYALAAAGTLDSVPPQALLHEPLPFPDPAAFVAVGAGAAA